MPKTVRLIAGGFFIPVALILAVQTVAPRFISIHEADFPLPSLNSLPYEFGKWQARGDETLDRAVTEYLRPDEYVLRDYVDKSTGIPINLFLAYFKTMQNSWGPHSPSVCLPGAGWQVRSSKILTIDVPGQSKGIPANEYILEKADQHLLVLYWYQNGRSAWADDFDSKQRQFLDLVRSHRSDISLVRLIMALKTAKADNSETGLLEFTRSMFPSLAERFASIN
jgi:EpsI family protein